MSDQATLPDSISATSLPASVDGAELYGSQVSPMMNLFGPDHAPVSHSVPPAAIKAKPMRATSGLYGRASSASVALQESLENRLVQRLPMDGWTKPLMTWKRRATPSRRRYCQLAVLGCPIEETDCGLWPTPAARDHFPAHTPEYVSEKKAQGHGMSNLNDAVALWPTPCVPNGGRQPKNGMSLTGQRPDGKKRQVDINYIVKSLWPTPTSRDWKNGQASMDTMERNARPLNEVAFWSTPTSTDAHRGVKPPRPWDTGVPLTQQIGFSAETGSGGLLNPRFVCWLMQYPTEWVNYADSVTP